jgi:signal transduction histidine kinase
LQRVVEYGGYVNLVLFTVVGLVALRQWRLGRGRAGLWAALTFGTLALVVDVAPLLDETPDRPIETFLLHTLVAVLVLFPYLLYRFTTAFQPPTRRLEGLLGLMTLVLLVWTYAVPEIPADGEPRSTGFEVYLVAFLFHWTVLSIVVAIRLWRGGREAPTVARRRLQVLAGAAAAITAALLLAGAGSDEGSAISLASTLLASASAIGFLVGLAPPPVLRLAWRRPENERLQAAIASLMGAASEEQVAEQVSEPMARIVGARAVALLDPAGDVIGAHGASEEMLERSGSHGEHIVEIPAAFGKLIVWTSPYAPYFGGEELRLLRTLGALTGLALDRARLYAQERDARLALERADELKSNFIALAAHELRAPVTSINGVIQTLHARGDRLDEDQRVLLREMLRDQGRRLGTLVEQLLDLSRLDAEAISIDPEVLPVRKHVEELVHSTAGERADDVRVEVPDDLEAAVDPAAFDRIVSNLVANALRYGEPPVIVRAEQRDRHFRVTVEDRGPGVSAEFVPDLFERFTRSTRAKERGLGTGLGLAIARSYANAHSGELVYEPASPTGARFELVIPSGNGHDDVRAHRLRSYRPPARVRARGLEPPRGASPNGT